MLARLGGLAFAPLEHSQLTCGGCFAVRMPIRVSVFLSKRQEGTVLGYMCGSVTGFACNHYGRDRKCASDSLAGHVNVKSGFSEDMHLMWTPPR